MGTTRWSSVYDDHPGHPLCGINPDVLEVAREVLFEAAVWGDVDPELAAPLADAVVLALRQAGFLR
jgi:hypothetical protein